MNQTITVKDLLFSDLYLGHPQLGDRFSDVPGANANPLLAGPILRDDLDKLIEQCRAVLTSSPSSAEFKINYDGVAYRVAVMHTLGGDIFVLRKIAHTIGSLAELGIPQAYLRHLMTKDLSGLFIISGAIKSGKTTTACTMIKERLVQYGGVAVTAEDPIELPLEGLHGQGICYQTTRKGESRNFAQIFRQVLRWGAKTILIDEIRDQQMAIEILQASINGHLIITTMLAENVIQTIAKLYALAHENLAAEGAHALLAEGLIGVLHQQLLNGPKKKLKTEFLYLKDAPLAKNLIRAGKFDMLGSDIKQQMAAMIAENAVANR